MKPENPLSKSYMSQYPAEVARVLEKIDSEHVAAFIQDVPVKQIAPVLLHILPGYLTRTLEILPATTVSRILLEVPITAAARMYRGLSVTHQKKLTELFSDKMSKRLRRQLEYPENTVGSLLDHQVDMLPEKINVADALHYIENLDHEIHCEIYCVDDNHRLTGITTLAKLIKSDSSQHLRDVMRRRVTSVSVHANASKLINFPAWRTSRRIAVVEKNNVLVGALDYQKLQDNYRDDTGSQFNDPMSNYLSLANIYWLSVTQLLDSLLGIAKSRKGGRS